MTTKEFDEYIKSYQRNLSGENLREFNEILDKLKNSFTYEEIIDRFERLEREEVEVEIEEEREEAYKNKKKYDTAGENKHTLTNKKGWLIFFSVFLLSIFLFYQFSQMIFNTNKKQAHLKYQSKTEKTKIKEIKKGEKNTKISNVVDENNKEIQKKQSKNLGGIKQQHEEFFKNLDEQIKPSH